MNITELQTILTESEIPFQKMDYFYPRHDARVWTLLVEPEKHMIFVTCKVNHRDIDTVTFDILASSGNFYGIDAESVADKIFQLLNR